MGNTVDSNTPIINQREVKFKLFIAIDFGTDGSGLAFAYNNKVTVYDKWRSKRQRRNKTKTQILLGPDNKVICFGDNAKMMYCGADDNTSKSWRFFERFKMSLYEQHIQKLNIIDTDDDKKIDDIEIKDELTATNGQKCSSKTLFVIAFKHLEQIAKEYLPKITTDDINSDEVQWILTVPAIWSENAKDKMKSWVISAGLVDPSVRDQCIIVYEPDCASAALQKQFLKTFDNKSVISNNNQSDDEIKVDSLNGIAGDKYILIDAGGGTVDVACHKILEDGGVEEIIHPTGDKWGSCYIDDLYIKLLGTIFPKEWIEEYKTKTPGKYVEIIDYFQSAKCTFYEDIKAKTHDIQLPYEFLCFLEEKCSQVKAKHSYSHPEAVIKQFRKPVSFYAKLFNNVDIFGPDNVFGNEEEDEMDTKKDEGYCHLTQVTVTSTRRNRNDEEYMEMDVGIWKCMFDAMINNIINHVKRLLSTDVLENQCKYLCMCGGFSASLYFQEKMKKYFGLQSKYNLNVIIPAMPMLSVVQGAAYIGITRQYIKARRLKYTYGIKMFFNKSAAINKGISTEYIKEHTTSDGMVRDCFKIIAKRNDRIALNEIKSCISFKTSQISLIPILRSNKRYPKVAADGMEESVLKIQHLDGTKEEIVTEFHFYGTMFSVYSYPKKNPDEKKQKVDINYAK